ncbi:hypothetical protein HZB00_00820 [Candidatus Woesearchaeota archaeon]|nr:hypothetical protein [Candidatus Woesearchaeota archaeon]
MKKALLACLGALLTTCAGSEQTRSRTQAREQFAQELQYTQTDPEGVLENIYFAYKRLESKYGTTDHKNRAIEEILFNGNLYLIDFAQIDLARNDDCETVARRCAFLKATAIVARADNRRINDPPLRIEYDTQLLQLIADSSNVAIAFFDKEIK